MRVVGLVSLSGGQGKTTSAFFLGLALAVRGLRVLWVDLDPQANLTFYAGLTVERGREVGAVLRRQCEVADAIYATEWERLFIVPSGGALQQAANEYLASVGGGGLVLRRRFVAVQDWFDVAIVDVPPARSPLVVAGAGAATDVLIPVECNVKGANCLAETVNFLQELEEAGVFGGRILGILPFRLKVFGSYLSRDSQEALQFFQGFGLKQFPALVESERVKVCLRSGEALPPGLGDCFSAIAKELGDGSY
ncbi:MAG: ParA family protein [Gloeomargarita sp. SKYG98]|nr:ParA family protein [Gloeomargarita sp. SKYG98]